MVKWVIPDTPSPEALAIAALEAKLSKSEALLAKAVEALEKVQAFVRDLEPYADQGHTLVPALHDACMTLKELNHIGNTIGVK